MPQEVVGLDIELKWLDLFKQRMAGKIENVHAYQGDVHTFPTFSSDFDVVTCQTVLMHCHDPQQVLKNMFSVLRPGGHCFIAESINQINRSILCESLASRQSTQSNLLWSFWNDFHNQKIREGAGDHNIAVRIPGMLHKAGFRNVRAIFNERIEFESAPFSSLDELVQEMTVPETLTTMTNNGSSASDIASASSAFQVVQARLLEEQLTVAHFTPMMLFSCSKP